MPLLCWLMLPMPSVIVQYLLSELEKGCVAGPFLTSPIPNLHVSRFGVIPKKHQPGKWRLILDLLAHWVIVSTMAF